MSKSSRTKTVARSNHKRTQRASSDFGSASQLNAISQYLEDISRFELLNADQERDLSRRSLACERVLKKIAKKEAQLAALIEESDVFDDMGGSLHDSAIEDLRDEIARLREESADVIASGQAAQETLVQHNLRLVVTIAKDFRRSGVPLLDLIQTGNEGLMHAAKKFDKDGFETPFANYAAYWVKQRLMKYTTEHGFATRIPPYRSWSLHRITKVSAQLMQRYGRAPTPQEVAEETGYDLREVEEILAILQPDMELDAKIKGEPGSGEVQSYFGESREEAQVREEDHVRQIAFRRIVERALGVLTEREAELMRLHYGLEGEREHDLAEIGKMFGFTRERARQIRAKAIQKIRESGVIEDMRDEV